MSKASIWCAKEQREVLPTYFNNYLIHESKNLIKHYLQRVRGQSAPTISRVLNALKNRIGDTPNAGSACIELKNFQQLESEVNPRVLRA